MATLSKVTAQGQISVPAEVRRKLAIGPGSILEWEERDGEYRVRRTGRYTSADIHTALFPATKAGKAQPIDVKQAIKAALRKRHAGR
jgi:AbrB family looped-hinge helix DNA binding protein